jgi:tripartite-type tricarboxylate transporter receptor subunit TctC
MKLPQRRQFLHLAAGAAALPAVSGVARAQAYPARPVTIVAVAAPGAASDLVVRVLAEKLSPRIGQPIIVDNVAGGGGGLGAQRVAKASPNGYVLGALNNGVHTILPYLGTRLGFDPFKDLVPITLLVGIPSVLIVNSALPVRSLSELIALAKQSPGKPNYASVGPGSPQHLAMEQLKEAAGIDLTHVPYRGGPQAALAIAQNEVNAFWIATSVAIPFIQAGTVRALAVGEPHRIPTLPNVPTVAEAGLPGYSYAPWLGLFAPASTPVPTTDFLRRQFSDALSELDVRVRLAAQGLEARTSTGEQLAALIVDEARRMEPFCQTCRPNGIAPPSWLTRSTRGVFQ